ncbi:hypothetical protein GCM10029992_17650 [Glycomyces albus]
MDILEAPLAGSRQTREQLLAFAERQARPLLLRIPTDGDDRERIPVPANGTPVPLPANLHRMLERTPYPRGRVSTETTVPHRIMGTIAASAPQRFEVRSAVNPHRAYPAAHCFYSAQIFLLAADAAWHYDAAAHRLVPVAGGGDLEHALRHGAELAVVSHLGSIPTRYRELRWSLSLCEAGHLLELLARAGAAHRLSARTRRESPDAPLLERLGLRAEDGWIPAGVVELDPDTSTPDLAPEPDAPGMSWAEVLFERTAGRANKGFGPAPVPLSAEAVDAVLGAIDEATDGLEPAADGGVDLFLTVRDATGLEPGCHRLEPGRPRGPSRVPT